MTSISPAPRRFLPEPVETSSRSSKRDQQELRRDAVLDSTEPPQAGNKTSQEPVKPAGKIRRFLPEPIEESTRSSRRGQIQHVKEASLTVVKNSTEGDAAESPASEFESSAPTQEKPAEPTTRRRFAPEPVETTTRSSRRKLVPEPVETSVRSSKDKQAEEQPNPSSIRRKFVPEPIDTTSTRRRRKQPEEDLPSEHQTSSLSEGDSRSGRRFSPDLVETAKASYKRNRVASRSISPKKVQSPTDSAAISSVIEEPPDPHESRFSAASLLRRQHAEARQPSFTVPNLPIIESDPSEEDSEPPSLSETPSASSAESLRHRRLHVPKPEISYTDYVLQLAAKTRTDKQIQDIAMSAYINERPHEPVEHFAVDHDDDEDGPIYVGKLRAKDGMDPMIFRRDSATDLNLEMEGMQKHHAQLESAKRDLEASTAGTSRFSAAALAIRQSHGIGVKKPARPQKDGEMARMRNAASPPMLGDDLVFPQSISPKMTRCDVDQAPIPRNTADNNDKDEIEGDPQLWTVHVNASNRSSAGLWMGMCQQPEDVTRPSTPLRSGLQTPAFESRNPFDTSTPSRPPGTPGRRSGRPYAGMAFLPLTPPKENEVDTFTASIDKKLNLEKEIEEEFPSRVITQIYNYLSLGYPSLAHQFDDELSKISRIPVEELRKDDHHTDAKGHVNAPEGEGVLEESVLGGKCKRWEALRLYCREWYRQRPLMADKNPNDWGARVRKGSWAF